MKEQCKYGSSCYRKRPEHFIEFDHPPDHQIANMFAKKRKIKDSIDSNEEPKLKIPRPEGNISNVSPRMLPNPFGLFVTKIPGVTSCDFPQDGFNFIFTYFDPLGYVGKVSQVTGSESYLDPFKSFPFKNSSRAEL